MKQFKQLMIIGLLFSSVVYSDEYTFGDGWQVGNSPVTLGGYVSSNYVIEKETSYFNIDDIAFLAYGEFDRFDFLAEFEIVDLYKKQTSGPSHESRGDLHIERLYGDYFFTENRRLRAGKFNSDIGFWNQMPINVLRDTTSSPRLTYDFFPKLTTGVNYEIRPQQGDISRISITLQHNNDIDKDYNNFELDRHYSVALDLKKSDILWRLSGGSFRYADTREAFYLLGGLKLERQQWSALIESVIRHDTSNHENSYDLYAQGVWHCKPKHDAILRAEVEKIPLSEERDTSMMVGYTYRPLENVALKAEYEAHEETLLNRWLFSFSVLF